MPAPEPGQEWVLSGVNPRSDSVAESELLKAARSAWPKALAHARQVQSQSPFNDDGLLVAEVWESVLQSVSMTLERMNGRRGEIGDLEAYLLGSFYHRLNRALRKEQRREEDQSTINGQLVLFVRDNGAGFNPKYSDKL